MADFAFKPLTHSAERINVVSTKLGPNANTKYSDKDKTKAVKMGPVGNFVLCAAGDDIEGFIDSVDAATSGGFSFGGVAHPDPGFRVEVKVAAGQTLVFNDEVVAGPQAAVGTESLPVVQKGIGVRFRYRVINLYTGAGAAGTTVLLEKI